MPPSKGVKDSSGWSQEQMVWGVIALLCTAVVCFGAGILVNKIQSKPEVASKETKETGQVERLPGAKDTKERSTPKSENPPKTANGSGAAGVQVSPAPVVIPDGPKDAAPPSRAVTQRDANSQFVPAPPPQREGKTETKPEPTPEAPAAPAPASETPKPVETAMQPTTPPETAPKPASAGPPSTPIDDLEPSAPAPAGGFTIQVGSFDTMANAEAFKKSIERKSDHTVTLYPVKDSKVVKACVGTYETKEAAIKVRAELDRIKDFKGCFVKPLSEL
jgi:cell division protein FtsN